MGGWGDVIGGPRTWARDLSLAVAIGLAISFLGPFGSYDRPLELRIASSVAYGVGGSVVFWPLMRLAMRLGERAGLPEPFTAIAGLILATAPVTLVVRLLAPLFWPGQSRPDLLLQYFGVLAIVLPIGLATLLVYRLMAPRPVVQASGPRLLDRVPPPLGREILALQAEDHYVRVHTAKGSTLLLMRFADAVAELDGLEGLRVHRSWWVARAAVAAVKPEGRRLALTLTNGIAAPVTRDAVPLVRRAGWV
jgi:hypothetical protein